jgi:hypothetical protein
VSRGEQRGTAQHEAEARAEDPARQDQQEEHQLHARRTGGQATQHGIDRRQHPEHGQHPRVEPALGDLREHDRDHDREQGEEHERRTRLATGRAAHEQRPCQHHQAGH